MYVGRMMMRFTLALGVFLGLAGAANAQNPTLENLSFAALPGDRFEVRLDFSSAPSAPSDYAIEQPARIVVDFPGVENALTERRFPLSVGTGKSAMVLADSDRTRLILNLTDVSGYNVVAEGNSYLIQVGVDSSGSGVASTPAGVEVEATPANVVAQAPASNQTQRRAPKVRSNEINNIDFRRGEQGEGRVIITLSNPSVPIDLEETGDGLQLTFSGASLPEPLRRRLDVVDFATPVTFIDANSIRNGAAITIESQGEYDYLAYQTDTEYVISVKPLTRAEFEQEKSRFDYVGEKLSLNFQDIEVRSVLQIIADFTELNLVASDTVSGSITLRLDNVPWDQALDLVLRTKSLDKRQVGNVLLVAPAAEIAERERQELETRKQLQDLAPVRTEQIRIRYANAASFVALFQQSEEETDREGPGIVSERGSVIVDNRTNSVILTDTAENIRAFKTLVEQLDIPIRQVMIEARIVIANKNFSEDLGVTLSARTASQRGDTTFEIGGRARNVDRTIPFAGDDLGEITGVDLGANAPTSGIGFDILRNGVLLDLELTALENSGNGEVVSQPKVITGDKQQASIESGTEIPFQEASASGATTTQFKDATLLLNVTPQITPDNNIIMDLEINQNSVGDVFNGVPAIDVTRVLTQVLVADGETVVLGGIYSTMIQNTTRKVPFLGDIPYLGRLFRNDSTSQDKRELLVFITPRIVNGNLAQ